MAVMGVLRQHHLLPQVAVAVAMAAMEAMVVMHVVAVVAVAAMAAMEAMVVMAETTEILVAEAVEPEVFLQMEEKAGTLIRAVL